MGQGRLYESPPSWMGRSIASKHGIFFVRFRWSTVSGRPVGVKLFNSAGRGLQRDPARGGGVSECSRPQAKLLRGGSMTILSDWISTAGCLRIEMYGSEQYSFDNGLCQFSASV